LKLAQPVPVSALPKEQLDHMISLFKKHVTKK
jgi:hypothetical protein